MSEWDDYADRDLPPARWPEAAAQATVTALVVVGLAGVLFVLALLPAC